MGRRQKAWAKKKRAELIALLGGKCSDPECETPDLPLEIDHPHGRSYNVSRLSPDRVIAEYMKEYRNGVPLRVLCSRCNKLWRNQPDKSAPLPDGVMDIMEDLPF